MRTLTYIYMDLHGYDDMILICEVQLDKIKVFPKDNTR